MTIRSWLPVAVLVHGTLAGSCGSHVLVAKDEQPLEAGLPELEAGLPEPRDTAVIPNEDSGEILCGSNVCGRVDLGGTFGENGPCCYNSRCGALLSSICVELDSPGVPDPNCPNAGPNPGCCRADNICGFMATGMRLGCVNPFTLFPGVSIGPCVYPDQ